MPSRIAATAADMPLYYRSFKHYAQTIADKTARHGLHVSPLPEIEPGRPVPCADDNSRVQAGCLPRRPLAHPIVDGPSGAEDIPQVPKRYFRIIGDIPERDFLRNTANTSETPYCVVLLDRKGVLTDLTDRYQFKVQYASWRPQSLPVYTSHPGNLLCAIRPRRALNKPRRTPRQSRRRPAAGLGRLPPRRPGARGPCGNRQWSELSPNARMNFPLALSLCPGCPVAVPRLPCRCAPGAGTRPQVADAGPPGSRATSITKSSENITLRSDIR